MPGVQKGSRISPERLPEPRSPVPALVDKPINKITVKEICDLAELNRATFYTHYRDCFDLLESMERELVEEFRKSMELIHAYDVSSLTEAIYGIAEKHQAVCRVLVFGNNSTSVLDKMIDLAHDKSLAYQQSSAIPLIYAGFSRNKKSFSKTEAFSMREMGLEPTRK